MTHKTTRFFYGILASVLLLAACAPAPQPTQSLVDIQNQIATSVALTVEAQNAQTAAAQPPATETPLPTATVFVPPTPILPTATPFVVVPPSSSGGSGGGGGGTKPQYACDPDIRKRPFDNSEFNQNAQFDIKWTIVNTGTKTWVAGLDLKYFSGPKMTTAGTVELPEMKPGDSFSVNFDAVAPAEKGFHVMTWVVEGGICYPYVAIFVK